MATSLVRPILAILIASLMCLPAKLWLQKRLQGLANTGPSLYAQTAAYHARSLKRYSLGFGNALSDLLWIRLLQKARHQEASPGKVSWEFVQLDAITTLDRKFERAYPFGAAYLSVFLRDYLGAKIILEKWVRHRPHYWRTHYLLGYHLYYEMNQYEEAAREILQAASLEGAPQWLHALGVGLLSETGAFANALKVAISLYTSVHDEEGLSRLARRIRVLRYSMIRASWEHALGQYRFRYGREPKRLDDLTPLHATYSRELASLFENVEVPNRLRTLFAESFLFKYDSSSRKIEAENPPSASELIGIHRPKEQSGS